MESRKKLLAAKVSKLEAALKKISEEVIRDLDNVIPADRHDNLVNEVDAILLLHFFPSS